jgi:hypothetical protein
MPFNERRKTERFPYSCPVNVTILVSLADLGTESSAPGEIVNVSHEGMNIQMKEPVLKRGTACQIRVPISETSVTIPVLSEVKWIKEKTPDNYNIGIRFLA